MAITQTDIAQQMVNQIRLLDPGISAEVGTPERKIIDTVSAALADAQVDLTGLQGSLNISAMVGSNLDAFLSIFGFGRQLATAGSGFVTFSITTPATVNIRIPGNTQVVAHNVTVAPNTISDITFYTLTDVILQAGATNVSAPIRASLLGDQGNVDAGAITDFLGSPPPGITSVTNDTAVTGGLNQETDAQLKVRFQNTVFRNLAGTEDQYLALAVSTSYTTRANVVGPVSKYSEYVQIPPVDDASSYDINGDGATESGSGNAGEYTTALSTVPYSKHTYDTSPVFVSNGQFSSSQVVVFYTQGSDFRMNVTAAAKDHGDTYRMHNLTPVGGITPAPIGPNPNTDPVAKTQPNITLINVYTGTDPLVLAARPNDLVLFEHQYMSNVSRNDWDRNITNAVDVFIDGVNPTAASTVIPVPTSATVFVISPNSVAYFDNYRRTGQPEHRPIIGNILTPLYFQPVVALPDIITVAAGSTTYTYRNNIHYWAVNDVSSIGLSVRARSGIEWSANIGAQASGDPDNGPYTGPIVTGLPGGSSIHVDNYTYDSNIATLQASLESNKQITTDVLAHQAKLRYIKLDVSIMYVPGASVQSINDNVQFALTQFLSGLFFGGAVQLSDLIQVIHNSAGVDNVRWSTDLPVPLTSTRIYETDINGKPLTNVLIDRRRAGTGSVTEIQQVAITGAPTGGTFVLTYNGNSTNPLPYNTTSGVIQGALNAVPISAGVTVTGTGPPNDPFVITFSALGSKSLITADPAGLTGGPSLIADDFFLNDNELITLAPNSYTPPSGLADTTPGLIVRVRSASTWNRG